MEISSTVGFKASVTCSQVGQLDAHIKHGEERTFDLMISSTGVFDWLAMPENCRRKTLLSGERIIDFEDLLIANGQN